MEDTTHLSKDRLGNETDPYLWQMGHVEAVDDRATRIKFNTTESCAQCLAGKGCGAGVFSQLFNQKGAILTVPSTTSLTVGQSVRVGVLPLDLLKASLWLYALPLAVFLATLILGGAVAQPEQSAWGEWLSFLAALSLGALALKFAGALRSRTMNPIVVPWSCDQTNC
ncbi:MAG TPA: SoxR reducing system RseC family protein [Wenzhouxiangella sp.]